MGRAPCCEKVGLNRGPWATEEDRILIDHIKQNGHENWRKLPKKAGLLRCGKSCRLRWMNYLRPDVKRGDFSKEEEDILIKLQLKLGNKWSAIAKVMPGRTDNEIKNFWNTHLKNKIDDHNVPSETKKRPRKRSKIVTQINVTPQVQNAQDSTSDEKSTNHIESTLELTKNGDQNIGNMLSSINENSPSSSISMDSNNNDDSLSKFLEIEDDFSWTEAMSVDLSSKIIPFVDGKLNDENMEFWYNIYTRDGGIEDLLQGP